MNKIILLVFAFSLANNFIYSQCNNIIAELTSQADIDQFSTNYPGCDTLYRIHVKGADITNLHGLLGIKTLRDELRIEYCPLLTDLRGLDSIRAMNAFISYNNESLESLSGLDSLTFVPDLFAIAVNNKLKHLEGLGQLETVGRFEISYNDSLVDFQGLIQFKYPSTHSDPFIRITDNPSLRNVDALSQLTGGFNLHVVGNQHLENINGLSNFSYCQSLRINENNTLTEIKPLSHIYGCTFVDITGNPNLLSLEGLEHITRTALHIEANDKITNLKGLENLRVLDNCWIMDNPSLTSIEEMSKLEQVISILIYGNPKLEDCLIPIFCAVLKPFDNQVTNNANDCENYKILNACHADYNVASGTVYLDLNCDQTYNTGDITLPNHLILHATDTSSFNVTRSYGSYDIYFPKNDTLEYYPKAKPGYTSHPSSYQVISTDEFEHFNDQDFALCPDTLFHDWSVGLTSDILTPGSYAHYRFCARNKGLYTESGFMNLDFNSSPLSSFITITSAAGGNIVGKKVNYVLQNIPPFGSKCFDVVIHLDPSTPLNDTLTAILKVVPQTSITELSIVNNMDSESKRIVGSFDPNAKAVDKGMIGYSEDGEVLEYTLYFQNTGNYPASYVELVDTLEPYLLVSSLEMIDASHTYAMEIVDSNIVKWKFYDINLVDSITNEPGSHGFVHFSIRTAGGIDVGTLIENRASIYFDFNLPVITNSAQTLVDIQIKTKEPAQWNIPMVVYPNPNDGNCQVQFELPYSSNCNIDLYDLRGQVVFHQELGNLASGTNDISFHFAPISNGMYFIRLSTDRGWIMHKLLLNKM